VKRSFKPDGGSAPSIARTRDVAVAVFVYRRREATHEQWMRIPRP